MSKYLVTAIIIFILVSKLSTSRSSVLASNISFSVANYYTIKGSDVKEGSIISSTNDGYVLTNKPYDSAIAGIVSSQPAILFNNDNSKDKYPVVYQGSIPVRVSTVGGDIEKGDLITSSEKPGIGMRSSRSGYIIGRALEPYKTKDENKFGLIKVELGVQYSAVTRNVNSNITDIVNLSELAAYEQPLVVFKYVIAAVIIVISTLLGLSFFGKIASHGIDALGRNPLASKAIQISIVLNTLIAIIVIGSGVSIAYIIIKL